MKEQFKNKRSNAVFGYLRTIRLSRIFTIIMGVLVITMCTSLAQADNDKTYPGSMCQARFYQDPDEFHTWYGSIMNVGDDYLDVNCPVVRDESGNVSHANVTVRDLNGNNYQDVYCYLAATKRIGDRVYSWSRSWNSTGSSAEIQNLVLYFGNFSPYGGASHFISCRIPPRSNRGNSEILSYHVIER